MGLNFFSTSTIFLICLCVISCHSPNATSSINEANISINPTDAGSRFPYLHTAYDGNLYMSWIQRVDTLSQLYFSQYQNGKWADPIKVAEAVDWFVNWADFPAIHRFGPKGLATHYLQKSGSDTYAYDVKLRISGNEGTTWSAAIRPHDDGTQTEHGFVSMFQTQEEKLGMVWLDGRKYGNQPQNGHAHHGQRGEMTLRYASFDENGTKSDESLLDDRVCDCCQTDAAMTSKGPIVVYRDRSDEEIRDIYYVRKIGDTWTEPQALSHDMWEINGCPVNGPAIAAEGDWVAATWFSQVQGTPMVQLSFSTDAGAHFMKPVRINEGNPLGRVDAVLLPNQSAVVSWIEQKEGSSEICLRIVAPNGTLGDVYTVASISAERASGFPRMALHDDYIWVVWTDAKEEGTRVEIRKIAVGEVLSQL